MTTKDVRPTLRSGDLAYWDSLTAGMVPCKVISISAAPMPTPTELLNAPSMQLVTFKLTAPRGVFKRGEIQSSHGMHVVPRGAYFKRRYGGRIGYYNVEADKS